MQKFLGIAALFVCSFMALTIGYAAQSNQAAQGQPQAQTQQSAAQGSEETAGQSKQFTNIQVLKDMPSDQLIPSMQFISASLGVECGFCHVTDKATKGLPPMTSARRRPRAK